jgi:hypothetical protein
VYPPKEQHGIGEGKPREIRAIGVSDSSSNWVEINIRGPKYIEFRHYWNCRFTDREGKVIDVNLVIEGKSIAKVGRAKYLRAEDKTLAFLEQACAETQCLLVDPR